jgi:hypothetical protein
MLPVQNWEGISGYVLDTLVMHVMVSVVSMTAGVALVSSRPPVVI